MSSIRHISFALPERAVANEELARENPGWEMESVVERAGVRSRRVSAPGETAFDLSTRACAALFEESRLDPAAVDAILYCTQSPDYVMPGNAHLLHRHLELDDGVLAFDYNLACSGYVYGLAFADSFIRGGLAHDVLLVTADTYSKFINPGDRSARVLFGDGAAVTHLSGDEGGPRIVASRLCTQGRDLEKFYIPAGGMRTPAGDETKVESTDRHGNVRSAEDIHMDGFGVWSFINGAVPGHVKDFLEQQSLTPADVDLYVFHQASQMTLDSLTKALDLDPDRMYVRMAEVGNLVSASIPVALRAALDEGRVGPGDRVLLCGFGVGLSSGSVLVEL
jgi:3-oxoacyl-[acyl-carrier-protein] synthase III